jgi:hypothetical protein
MEFQLKRFWNLPKPSSARNAIYWSQFIPYACVFPLKLKMEGKAKEVAESSMSLHKDSRRFFPACSPVFVIKAFQSKFSFTYRHTHSSY